MGDGLNPPGAPLGLSGRGANAAEHLWRPGCALVDRGERKSRPTLKEFALPRSGARDSSWRGGGETSYPVLFFCAGVARLGWGIVLEKYRRSGRGSWLWRASFGAFVFGSLSTLARESAATEASTEAKGRDEGTRARGPSLRFALERSYGQWERLYDGEWAGESGGARFSGSASEGLWGWRGRGEIVFGELAHFCGKLGPWFELADPFEHSVTVAGQDLRFRTAPLTVGLNTGLEYRFLREILFVGAGVGIGSVFENIRARTEGLSVLPGSLRLIVLVNG